MKAHSKKPKINKIKPKEFSDTKAAVIVGFFIVVAGLIFTENTLDKYSKGVKNVERATLNVDNEVSNTQPKVNSDSQSFTVPTKEGNIEVEISDLEPPAEPTTKPLGISGIPNVYESLVLGFAVDYPEGWTVNDSRRAPSIFKADPGVVESMSEGAAGLAVTTLPLEEMKGIKLGEFSALLKEELENQFEGAVISIDENTNIRSQNAHVFGFFYSLGGVDFAARYYIILSEDDVYTILVTASTTQWKIHQDTLMSMVQTFRLL